MRINPQEFVSFPKEMVIGFVPGQTRLEEVEDALEQTGLNGDQIDFLQGNGGLEILTAGGASPSMKNRLIRKLEMISQEGGRLSAAVDQLQAGNTVVAIRGVKAGNAPEVREALEMAGVGNHHYFGRLTFD